MSAEESLYLDFKASGSLAKQDKSKKEISKDVSAFANSEGGIIIYGISEENHIASFPSFINGSIFTKEWLENIISSNVQRRISDLRIYPVRFDDDITKSVYVVKIPQSPDAPHMASDRRFYKRYNFESAPMEEYEVRMTYNRKQRTKLTIGDLQYTHSKGPTTGGNINYIDYTLYFRVKNASSTVEERCKLEISVPKEIYNHNSHINSDLHLSIRNDEVLVFSESNRTPIFENEENTMAKICIRVKSANLKSINVKLYYSNGSEEKEFHLDSLLDYDSKSLGNLKWGR